MLSRLFSNYLKIIKIKGSQIVLNFILKILQSAKSQTRLIFFSPRNSSVIYNYVFLCYPYKSKIEDCVEFHIDNITICYKTNTINIFSPQNRSIIYNNVFLCYLDCFQTI